MPRYATWVSLDVFLGKQAPLRGRRTISTISETRYVATCGTANLSTIEGALSDAGPGPAPTADFLPLYGKLVDLVACLTEGPLDPLLLAGRQLEMRMDLECGPARRTGATLHPEVMQDLVLPAFDFRPVERCQLGSNGGAELGNLLALGIVGSCFQFESRDERGYRVDVVSDHVGATAHGFHQAGSPSDEGIQDHRAVQRHLTQEGVPKAVRFISIKRKTGQN
ncbi:MAG: hypothetical protein DRH70_05940 [Candidatus Coatesbacteria bacterium]|nr:MAG: hypothetical protein DRH70_05940 [Candidatus Coatesbacteria bacterium]